VQRELESRSDGRDRTVPLGIQDHLITMTQNLNHYKKILSRTHSNYLAQISIEMTDTNNQKNEVLSKLTALGTILIPMNLITGIWGMNVHVPGQNIEGFALRSAKAKGKEPDIAQPIIKCVVISEDEFN